MAQDARLSVLPTDSAWTLLGIRPLRQWVARYTGLSIGDTEKERDVLELLHRLRLDLQRISELPFRHLSASERKRVLLAMALQRRPKALLFDGWNETMDARDRAAMGELLHETAETGVAVIVSSRIQPSAE